MEAEEDSGCPDLFKVMLREHRDGLKKYAFAVADTPETGEDLYQEALARALENFDQLEDTDSFGAWVRRIIKNLHRSKQRRRSRRPTVGLDEIIELEAGSTPDIEPEVLERTVEELPEQQREAVRLYHYREYSVEEINDLTGVPKSTIRTRLQRGREQLREWLTGEAG